MRTQRRQAFTLVEMLVAMALIVFIMSILSEAFVLGLKTFRDLKAVGDMDQKLRTVTMLLRDDLSNDHFTGRLRLSDPNFWNNAPPREGYFRIVQRSALAAVPPTGIPPGFGYFLEGVDSDGIGSYVATDHVLDFTVKRRGNQRDRFFSISPTPGNAFGPLLSQVTNFDTDLSSADSRLQTANGNYSTQWGQVAYFLLPTPDGTRGTAGGTPLGTPLFSLFRMELGVVPDNSNVNWQNPPPPPPSPQPIGLVPAGAAPNWAGIVPFQNMSCFPGQDAAGNTTVYFNNPTDLASPTNLANRAFDPTNPAVHPKTQLAQQATELMTNVISFQVQVLRSDFTLDYTDPVPGPFPALGGQPPVKTPAYTPTGGNVFDTSLPAVAPAQNYTISALKISIRVWDEKTNQARQITIIQDM